MEINTPFVTEIAITALRELEDVVIQQSIPGGLAYIGSQPSATERDGVLYWRLNGMRSGQTARMSVQYRPVALQAINVCATATVVARNCYSGRVTQPRIAIRKAGPAQGVVGETLQYTVVVMNEGNAVARNVVVTDFVPDGLRHASGNTRLANNLGDLAPGEQQSLTIPLQATRRGRVCNRAIVQTANAGEAESEACTELLMLDMRINKTGPEMQYFTKRATYQIVVSNPADAPLRDVRVVDTIPAETQLLDPGGGAVQGRTITWLVPVLNPGEQKGFNVTLTSTIGGTHENVVEATSREGLRRNAAAATLWRGLAALLIEVIDVEDPLTIGSREQYIIKVKNQGTERDTNVRIVANFPPLIAPTGTSGSSPGSIVGNTVRFEPVRVLEPKQIVTWNIDARAVDVGDARLRVELMSDLIKEPVTEEESTHVY
jgi:uncharacterized repeat protein (TIGR01451 family)